MLPVLAADSAAPRRGAAHAPAAAPPGARAARVALLRAVVGGSLDRAMDVAATLEVRGFADRRARARRAARAAAGRATTSRFAVSRRRDPRRSRWSARARRRGRASTPTRVISMPLDAGTLALCCRAASLAVLLPFADRRGIEP